MILIITLLTIFFIIFLFLLCWDTSPNPRLTGIASKIFEVPEKSFRKIPIFFTGIKTFFNGETNDLSEVSLMYDYLKDVYEISTPCCDISEKLSNIKIYIINLEKDTERKKYLMEEIECHNVKNWEFFPAISGKNIDEFGNYGDYKIFYNKKKNLPGEIGCAMSHMLCAKKLLETTDEYCLILEDDVTFRMVQRSNDSLNSIIQKAPGDWNAITLFNNTFYRETYSRYSKYFNWSTACYILNRKGAKELLSLVHDGGNIFDFKNMTVAYDIFLSRLNNYYVYGGILFTTRSNFWNTKSSIRDDDRLSYFVQLSSQLSHYKKHTDKIMEKSSFRGKISEDKNKIFDYVDCIENHPLKKMIDKLVSSDIEKSKKDIILLHESISKISPGEITLESHNF